MENMTNTKGVNEMNILITNVSDKPMSNTELMLKELASGEENGTLLNDVLDRIKKKVKKECNYNNLLRPYTLSDVFYAIEQAVNEEEKNEKSN